MADQSSIARHVASVSSTVQSLIDFGTTVQKVYIKTLTNDVFVGFNESANTDSYRVLSSNTADSVFEFSGSNIRTVSLLAQTGTANVYVLGVVA